MHHTAEQYRVAVSVYAFAVAPPMKMVHEMDRLRPDFDEISLLK
jgi:hypothetical protein